MKALLCKALGPPETLVLEDMPTPSIGDNQLLIDVAAAAVNFPDVLMIEGKYQFKPELPFAPGGEIAGSVRAAGKDVRGFKPGDRILGSCGSGGFAEQVALDATHAIPIPDSMPWPKAAAFLLTYGTSYHALADRARLAKGETLLVLGAGGGVGLAAVELGRAMGAKVIAAASDEAKLALARKAGAHETLIYPRGPLDRAAQRALSAQFKEASGGGVDVLYDPVGGDYAEPALRAMNWKGRYLVVGFAAGEIPRPPLNLALLKGCDIVGVFWGDFTRREPKRHEANMKQLAEWFVAGTISPHVSKTWPLARGGEALRAMLERQAQGKLVILTPKGETD